MPLDQLPSAEKLKISGRLSEGLLDAAISIPCSGTSHKTPDFIHRSVYSLEMNIMTFYSSYSLYEQQASINYISLVAFSDLQIAIILLFTY
jgi:hypothetical protein